MKKEERHAKQLARLEQIREQTQQRMDQQRRRLDERIARAQRRFLGDKTHPNDDQQRIITTALALLDEVGLNELSLRKLAARLDCKAPALYWHFENKETLIDYMAEAILQAEFHDLAPRQDHEAWQDWLVRVCNRLRYALSTHRDGARVVAGAHLNPAITLIRLFEVTMQSLMSAGIEMQRANLIITTAIHFVFGNVIEEQSSPSPEALEKIDFQALNEHYPLFARSLELSLEAAVRGYDEFEDALRLIVGFKEM